MGIRAIPSVRYFIKVKPCIPEATNRDKPPSKRALLFSGDAQRVVCATRKDPIHSEKLMATAKDFAEIARALAWPITAVGFLVLFYRPIRGLLYSLASALTVKKVTLKAFGAEIELTPEDAKRALDELLQEIALPTNELTQDEVLLFYGIIASAGQYAVIQLRPHFTHDDDNIELQRLRKLRQRKLVRPLEGGPWKVDSHPIVTRFGELVYKLRSAKSPH
jgi:hypothetical protein